MNFESRDLRNALGRFATGVCVITAAPANGAPFGMTVNSFTAVSLEPPLVLWSLQNTSECAEAMLSCRNYTINVLARDQLHLSQKYSQKQNHELLPEHYRQGRSGAPVLRGSLVTLECEVWRNYDGGDHQILVGKVLNLENRPTGKPLVFYSGAYRELR